MRWRKRVTAETLEALRAAAEEQFPPGTPYAIDVITEEGLTGVTRVRYRAEALTLGTGAHHRTPPPRGKHVRTSGAVADFNPRTVDEFPAWRPDHIPRDALLEGPRPAAAFSLLQDTEGRSQLATDDPALETLLERLAPDRDAATGRGEDAAPRGRAAVTLTVYAGLLDDAIEAAECSGDHRWSAAGALSGGQPGASVVCYGLGDGNQVERLAEGLHHFRDGRLLLAVDPSRKHADTLAWVSRVAAVVTPALLVAVPRTATATPETVQGLGYPVRFPG